MKNLLILILLLVSFASFGQVKVAGYIETNGVASYPTHIDSMGRGGLMVVADATARTAIPLLRKKVGMVVSMVSDGKLYRLTALPDTWAEIASGSAGSNCEITLTKTAHGFPPFTPLVFNGSTYVRPTNDTIIPDYIVVDSLTANTFKVSSCGTYNTTLANGLYWYTSAAPGYSLVQDTVKVPLFLVADGKLTLRPLVGFNLGATTTSGGQASVQFKDEGSNLGTSGTVTDVNVTGSGATSSRSGNTVTINIPGGGSSNLVEVPVIIIPGESNTGGYALNTELDAGELAPRKQVQIWGNPRHRFETLDIGTNNLELHSGLSPNATHGFENGLANDVYSRYNLSKVYLVKAGQGASKIENWTDGVLFSGISCPDTLAKRINQIKDTFAVWGYQPKFYVWISLGINDALAGTSAATFETKMRTWFSNIRTLLGQNRVPFILTRIMRTNSSYQAIDDKIQELADEERDVYAASITGATLRDANHWDAAGMELISQRMTDILLDSIGLAGSYRGTPRADITPPSLTSAYTDDGNTSRIVLNFNEPLNPLSTPATTDFTVSGKTVSSVSHSGGSAFYVTFTTAFAYGDVIQISYSGTALEDAVGNNVATFTNYAVTNSISSPGLTAVTWGDLQGGATNSGSGTLASTSGTAANSGTESGGTATTTINNSGAWEVRWRLSTSNLTENEGAVLAIDDVASENFWGSPSVTNVCAYYVFTGTQHAHTGPTTSSGTTLTSATLGHYKRFLKSGNDVLLQTSADDSSWSTIHTFTGVLTGLTTLYLKGTFAVTGTDKKIYFVRK